MNRAAPSDREPPRGRLGEHRDADHHRHGERDPHQLPVEIVKRRHADARRPNNAGPPPARRRRPRSGRSRSAPRRGPAGPCRSPRTSARTRCGPSGRACGAIALRIGGQRLLLMPKPPPRRGTRRRAPHNRGTGRTRRRPATAKPPRPAPPPPAASLTAVTSNSDSLHRHLALEQPARTSARPRRSCRRRGHGRAAPRTGRGPRSWRARRRSSGHSG